MVIALVPVAFVVAGLLMYALASNPKVSEMGRLAFFCGLFWMTYTLMGHALHL